MGKGRAEATKVSDLAAMAALLAQAWDEGYIVGLDKARQYTEGWSEQQISREIRSPSMPNPYRKDDDG